MRSKTRHRNQILTKLVFFLVSIIAFGGTGHKITAQTIKFTDVTRAMEVRGHLVNDVSCYGHGVIMADISGDSLPDIYISNAVRKAQKLPEVLYISTAGGPYVENDYARGVSDPYGATGSHGIIFVDYDNDGHYDIFNATTDDWNRLYRNKGNGFYEDVTAAVGIPRLEFGTRGVVAFDANNDGFMDLYCVNWGPVEDKNGYPQITPPQPNEFYRNLGNGKFTRDDSRGLSFMNSSNVGAQGVTALDIDNDGDMDVFISYRNYSYLGTDDLGNPKFGPDWNKPAPNKLLINDGTGRFTDETKKRGLFNTYNDTNGTTFADFDNDGDLDIFVVPKDWSQKGIWVDRNDGNGFFQDITEEVNIRQWGFSCIIFDVDNDGDLDVYSMRVEREANALYLNDGTGKFSKASNTGLEKNCDDPRAAAVGDIDNDGDLDLYFVDANKKKTSAFGNYLFRNDTQTNNRWLKIHGRGPKGDMGGFGTKIWVFDHGFMDDMNHLVGYKQVMNAYGYLCQDDPVQHFGLGQRDTVDVKITLLDGTTLKAYHVAAKQRISFSKPSQMTKLSGDQQEGRAGQTLGQPLRVQVRDSYDQPVIGVPIQFEVLDANGQILEAQPVYTNKQGLAQVHYVLGNNNNTQHIQASSALIPGQNVQFTALVTQALPERLELISSATMMGTAGAVLADSLKVRVMNSFGTAQPNHSVKFEVIAGGGHLLPGNVSILERTTNASGYATAAWQLGNTVNIEQSVRISSAFEGTQLTGSPITVTATASPAQAASLTKISGDLQIATVGTVVAEPLLVKVMDTYENLLSNVRIRFQVLSGGGNLNNSNSVLVTSDANGQASVTGWRLGQQANIENRLRAQVVADTALFVDFTATTKAGPAAVLKWLGKERYIGIVNQYLGDSLVVQVTDAYNNPIGSHPVDFNIMAGGGQVNGQASSRAQTNNSGRAYGSWKLGQIVGLDNNVLKIESQGLSGSPVSIYATAQVTGAYKLVKISGDGQSGLPETSLNEPLRVAVTDTFDNPVKDHEVFFSVTSGEANFGGLTTTTVRTLDNGQAQTDVTVGRQIGRITIQATGQYNGNPLFGAPVEFSATVLVGQFDPLQSTLTATSPILADGKEKSLIEFKARDSYGNPVPGLSVEFIAIGDANILVQPNRPTDAVGLVTGYLASTRAETKMVWIRVNGVTVNNTSVSVVFTPGPAAKMIKVAGDRQAGAPGEVLPQALKIQITDAFDNPVANVITYFKVVSGGGKIAPNNVVNTDSLGQAEVQWRLGQIGKQEVQAMVIGNDSLKTDFTAFFNVNRPPEIITFEPMDSLLTVKVGQQVHFKIEATDKDKDSLKYEWYLNGTLINQGQRCDVFIQQGFPELTTVKVKITDSFNWIEKSWTLHVQPISAVDSQILPAEFSLAQNYPNPFNPTTTIAFQVPIPSWVSMVIFNPAGQMVRELTNQFYPAGVYQVVWDAKDQSGHTMSSGVYYYKMQAGDFQATHKLLLLK